MNFTNTGTVTNLIGILNFSEGGSLTGTYGTAAGATIDFSGRQFHDGCAAGHQRFWGFVNSPGRR